MRLKVLMLVTLAGCGGTSLGGATDGGGAVDSGAPPDLTGTQGTQRLIASDYTLAAGEEAYLCKRVTLTSDVLIHKIIPVSGLATHHELLGIDVTGKSPDGLVDCTNRVEFDVIGWKMLFASGVGSPALTMPDGVGLVVRAGQQIVFQMHLLNASTKAITSSAAIDYEPLAAADLKEEAGVLLAGPLPDSRVTPSIPVGPGHVVSGLCSLPAAARYFAVFPHMHQVGRHIKVTTTVAGAESTLYDEDYDFNNQVFKQVSPIAMSKGDRIGVSCTYDNETGKPVQFGQSSLEEMCFAISFVTPAPKNVGVGAFCFQ